MVNLVKNKLTGWFLQKKYDFLAIILFALVVYIGNWSILSWNNFMKYDIFDAQYPMQVIVSDAMKSGQLVLWLPLMNFGTPYYAMVGTPVWYPVTLILNLIGYTPMMPGVEYSLHMVIAAFGVFLLTGDIISQKGIGSKGAFLIRTICGISYGFSTVYLSNAQHIMFCISAAWVPYVFYYYGKYLLQHRFIDAMKVGIFAGFILLGGYPEAFADLFLAMVPYTVYQEMKHEKEGNIHYYVKRLFRSVISYVIVTVLTLAFSSITLLPFVNIMNDISRGIGQDPLAVGVISILSMFIPSVIDNISAGGTFYLGIATAVVVFLVKFKDKEENLSFFYWMSLIALFLSFGSDSFLHSLLYRFVPLYSSFRFPSLWRIFFALFTIYIYSHLLVNIFTSNEYINAAKAFRYMSYIFIGIGITLYVVLELRLFSGNAGSSGMYWVTAMIVCGIFSYVYCRILNFTKGEGTLNRACRFFFVVIIEILSIHNMCFALYIAQYDQTAYYRQKQTQVEIGYQRSYYRKRNTVCDFKDNLRSTSLLNSKNVMFDKTFDEDGYLSVILKNTQDYKDSYNCRITQAVPEIYFTNDVVDASQVDYSEWLDRPENNPYQIYLDDNGYSFTSENLAREKLDIVSEDELNIKFEDDKCIAEGTFTASNASVDRIRVYFDNIGEDKAFLRYSLKIDDSVFGTYEGNFTVEDGHVDIAIPTNSKKFTSIEFDMAESAKPESVCLVHLSKPAKDNYISMNSFLCNSIDFDVDAPNDGIVAVLQNNYKGWKATVDNKNVNITDVDKCFIGIPVTQGHHHISLRFVPRDFYIGLFITAVYLIVFVIMTVMEHIRVTAK